MTEKGKPREMSAAEAARTLVRQARKATLATLEKGTGIPYASLVTVATEPDGTPLLLVSRLAVHTQNLLADPRASLLFDGSGADGDPLAGGRVTLIGHVEPIASPSPSSPSARSRFLARQPGAAAYVDFGDFGFLALRPQRAHYIGGFGRIVDLEAGDLLLPTSHSADLIAAEADIVAHMNADHAEAVTLYATRLAGAPADARGHDWHMTGIDPHGLDLVGGELTRRLWFASRIDTPEAARQVLASLAREARGRPAA